MPADALFSERLHVRLSGGFRCVFDIVNDTLDCLENKWLICHDERYRRACVGCRTALGRRTPLAVARDTFAAACLDTGMSIELMPQAWQGYGRQTSPRLHDARIHPKRLNPARNFYARPGIYRTIVFQQAARSSRCRATMTV
jgi:hypothetical protein